jgi:cholest-4-en-3-one 26-monooxygenase
MSSTRPLDDDPASDTQRIPLAALDLVGPDTYADHGYPHAAWARLRREAPIFWCAPGADCTPFWAVTKHADIARLSRQPKLLQNGPRLAVFPEGKPTKERIARHLLNMDPPEHPAYRKLTSHRFTPRAIQSLRPEIERITRDLLDELLAEGAEGEIDFVERISAPLPLAVLCDLLGVPRSDWQMLFRWTNTMVGAGDPEYQGGGGQRETANDVRMQLFQYFMKMADERRKRPADDITSVLANAKLEDGSGVPPFELLSYYFLLVVAGNETTRNAMTGGLLAFIENPDEWRKLVKNPALVDPAVEEIVRWTTPVIQFCRTATQDYVLRDQKIRAGESLCLFYPSANRDEEVFDEPFRFRIDRWPNEHIGFGRGEHVCLGAHLARLELRTAFAHLRERLEHAELAGPAERARSSFVGGIKRAPMRWKIRPARDS